MSEIDVEVNQIWTNGYREYVVDATDGVFCLLREIELLRDSGWQYKYYDTVLHDTVIHDTVIHDTDLEVKQSYVKEEMTLWGYVTEDGEATPIEEMAEGKGEDDQKGVFYE